MLLACMPEREVQPIAERVHDGNTQAMQSARDLIGVIVRRVLELAARMKLSHDDFGGCNAFFAVNAGRYAATNFSHAVCSVRVQHDIDTIDMTGQKNGRASCRERVCKNV